MAAGTTFHVPVATGTTTLPFESRIRKGPEAETTASPRTGTGGTPGRAAFPAAAGLAPAAGAGPLAPAGGDARGPGGVPRDDSPSSTATRTRAGSLAGGTFVGWMPP